MLEGLAYLIFFAILLAPIVYILWVEAGKVYYRDESEDNKDC